MKAPAWGLGLVLAAAGLAAAVAVPAPDGDLHGRFIQEKRVAGLPQALTSRGDFVLLRGRGLVWRTEAPLRGTVVLGPRGVWSLDSTGSSRRVAAGGEALELMSKLMSQDAAGLGGFFVVTPLRAVAGFRQRLTPRSPMLAKLFQSITVRGASASRLDEAVLQETGGDRTVIRFRDVADGRAALLPAEEALLGP